MGTGSSANDLGSDPISRLFGKGPGSGLIDGCVCCILFGVERNSSYGMMDRAGRAVESSNSCTPIAFSGSFLLPNGALCNRATRVYSAQYSYSAVISAYHGNFDICANASTLP